MNGLIVSFTNVYAWKIQLKVQASYFNKSQQEWFKHAANAILFVTVCAAIRRTGIFFSL